MFKNPKMHTNTSTIKANLIQHHLISIHTYIYYIIRSALDYVFMSPIFLDCMFFSFYTLHELCRKGAGLRMSVPTTTSL